MKKLFISITALFFTAFVFAQDIPDKPSTPRLVNDFANVIPDQQEELFEAELVQFNNATSTQITVVTVTSLNGYDPADFATRLGEEWKVGQKDKNNGIVVLFKPKTDTEKGQVFVAIGYGLEGIIPDAIANRDVIDFEMLPRFKQGDIFGGLYHGTRVLMSLASKEYTADEYHQMVSEKQPDGLLGGIIFFLMIFIVIPILLGRRRRPYSGGGSLPFLIAMGMMGSGRSSNSGSFSNFSGGGGGFGGFGGGSFGGGGAGGSW